jgi:hypothetical protein
MKLFISSEQIDEKIAFGTQVWVRKPSAMDCGRLVPATRSNAREQDAAAGSYGGALQFVRCSDLINRPSHLITKSGEKMSRRPRPA